MRVSSIVLATGYLLASSALAAPTQNQNEAPEKSKEVSQNENTVVEKSKEPGPPYTGGLVWGGSGYGPSGWGGWGDWGNGYPDDSSSSDDDDDADGGPSGGNPQTRPTSEYVYILLNGCIRANFVMKRTLLAMHTP
jgi:hypothetical protein